MPPWLQVLSTIVAAAFTIGTVGRGVATWVWTNTIKRDLKDLREYVDRVNKRVDEWDGSEVWGVVQHRVGEIEVDQKLLNQRAGYLAERIASLENINAARDNRSRINDRRNGPTDHY